MRTVVGIEAHFVLVNGLAYSSYLTYESFWHRYLDVFDSVLIIARATKLDHVPPGYRIVTEKGVELAPLPRYHGPYQYIKKRAQIRTAIRQALRPDDAVILRVPGNVSTQLWRQLRPGYPFAVEVVIDPWDTFAPGSVRSMGRPFFRWNFTRNLKKQCRQAVAAAYVTQHALQKRYPPNKNAFTTHYSSVDLDSSFIITDPRKRLAEIDRIPARLRGEGPPVRLGFIGTFSQGYKLPDIHIKAFANCVHKGANLIFEMIGDGRLLNEMKSLTKQLGISERVSFRGKIPGGKPIIDALDNFDIFLNATAAEGLPRVVIEAMSRGCPCIASNVAGTPELLEERYLVPPGDAKKLAETILFVLRDPKVMAKTVHRNINVARKYCKDMLQPRRRAFYETLYKQTEEYMSKRH